MFNKKDNNLEDKIAQLQANIDYVNSKNNDLKKQLEDSEKRNTEQNEKLNQQQNNLNNLEMKLNNANYKNALNWMNIGEQVAKAPLFNLDINQQIFKNGNNQNQIEMLVKEQIAKGCSNKNIGNFFTWRLLLERAQYFRNRLKIKAQNKRVERFVMDCLYNGAMYGSIAVDKNKNVLSITKIDKDFKLTGTTINIFNNVEFTPETITVDEYAVYQFNENSFGLLMLCWDYLELINQYFNTLDAQSKFLIKQLVVKVENTQLNERQDILNESLFNTNTPLLTFGEGVTFAPLNAPSASLQEIFTFIENFQNYMDFHIANILTKDITSDKERDVASQQSAFANISEVKNNYLNSYVDVFLEELNEMLNWNVTYEDYLQDNLDNQAQQAQTMNKLNDESEKEANE